MFEITMHRRTMPKIHTVNFDVYCMCDFENRVAMYIQLAMDRVLL